MKLTRRSVQRDPLLPYDPAAVCAKCGHDDVLSFYSPGGCSDSACWTCAPEHIARSCRRCSYQWAEAPIDESG